MKKSKFGKQEEQYPLNIGDAIFVINPLKNKVTEYRVTYLHNGMVEAVSGVSDDIFYHISTIGQLFFMSRVEAKEYLRNNRQSILDEYRKIFEKTGDWSRLAELGNILAEEKEKSPSGRGEYSAEDVESAIATVAYIKLMFEKDCSIDWQIETGLWTPEGVDNPVRYHKDLVAKGLEGAISILASLQ